MGAFEHWGSNCEDMFKTLDDAKDYESLLVLAEAVLSVRIKDEPKKAHSESLADTPFYFNYLSYVKVFEYLLNVDDEYTEQALDLATKVMANVIASERSKKSVFGQLQRSAEEYVGIEREVERVFAVDDFSLLHNVDLFDPGSLSSSDHDVQDDVRELATVITMLARKLIGGQCDKPEAVYVYKKYFGDFDNPDAKLPDSQAMWRLRLFVLSLCPEVFRDELKKALFRLFEVEQYHEIIAGTEYKKALQKGFIALSEEDNRDYVKRVVEYFTRPDRVKETGERDVHMHDGSQILSMITDFLTEDEKSLAQERGLTLDPGHQPVPLIDEAQGGWISSRGPITQEKFGKLSIAEITEKLRHEWTPEKLVDQNTMDDFLNPLNAYGVGELLKNDIPKRLQEYVRNAGSFFERGMLDEHYTYSFLRGIQETIQAHGETASKVQWDGVIDLCMAIKVSGEKDPFEQERRDRGCFDTFRAGWVAVHSAMTDVLKVWLTKKTGLMPIDFGEYRDRIFSIAHYLLSYPNPSPEDEQIEIDTSKTKSPWNADYKIGDPFSMAINSVRGKAFEAFVWFVCRDDKNFKEEDNVKIADDVKELYEGVLKKENTRAIRFMFGHYLLIFYSRDRDWIRNLLPRIFPQKPAKKLLYTAAWEGYLANKLYKEMFFDSEIQKLYERGLALTDADYPQQKHFKAPDESLAEHLALAFMHCAEFGDEHPLFCAFLEKNDPELYAKFVNFLGRSFVSGDSENARELFQKKPESKQRLIIFWEWLLEHCEDPKPFTKFDSWINLEKEIFEPAWLAERAKKTLEKTKGRLGSDYQLAKSIIRLAQANPKDTLEIAQRYLLEGGVRCNEPRRFSYVNVKNEWKEAFKILYDTPAMKSETSILINKLIQEGGSPFWGLKEIVDKNGKSPI